jgi:acetyl esterase
MLSFHEELARLTPPEAATWPLARQRQAWEEVCLRFRAKRSPRLMVEDLDASGVHVRVFRPPGNAPKPGVLYLHGGGWILGSCETHDDMAAEIAEIADVVVVLADYRLAPEHPHPAQLDDALAVLDWMRSSGRALGIDPTHITAAGDSSGGRITATLALAIRDRGLPALRGQVLIYASLGNDLDTASYQRHAEAPCLTRADMIYYLEAFLGPRGSAGWVDATATPNLASDLTGLPPTFIIVAEHDPTCDDGAIYADKLRAAGVPVQHRNEPALAHSFMRARHVSAPAMAAFRAIAEAVRSLAHEGMLPG